MRVEAIERMDRHRECALGAPAGDGNDFVTEVHQARGDAAQMSGGALRSTWGDASIGADLHDAQRPTWCCDDPHATGSTVPIVSTRRTMVSARSKRCCEAHRSGSRHRRPPRVVVDQLGEAVGDRCCVAAAHQQPVFAVIDDLGDPRHGRRHHRQACAERLQEHRRQSVLVAVAADQTWRHEDVRLTQPLRHLVLPERAREVDPVGHTEFDGASLEAPAIFAVTDDDAGQGRSVSCEDGHGIEEHIEALLLDQSSDPEHEVAPTRRQRGRGILGAQPVVDADDAGTGAVEAVGQVAEICITHRDHRGRRPRDPRDEIPVDAVAVDVLGVRRDGVRHAGEEMGEVRCVRGDRQEVRMQMIDSLPSHCLGKMNTLQQDLGPTLGGQAVHEPERGPQIGRRHVGQRPQRIQERLLVGAGQIVHAATHRGDAGMESAFGRVAEREDRYVDADRFEAEDLAEDECLGETRVLLQDIADTALRHGRCSSRVRSVEVDGQRPGLRRAEGGQGR